MTGSKIVCAVLVLSTISFAQKSNSDSRQPDFSYRKNWPESKQGLFQKRQTYQSQWVDMSAYGSRAKPEVYQILDDYYRRGPFVFDPVTQYQDAPFQSSTLNVRLDPKGFSFRAHPHTARANEKTVFVLGASSMFGVHVSDSETVPYYLEQSLREAGVSARVTNFGRCGYSWPQELILLTDLLARGHRPNAVVFVDGINLPSAGGAPMWSQEIGNLWDQRQGVDTKTSAMNRAYRFPPPFGKLGTGNAVAADYLRTHRIVRALGKEFGFETLMVWQPNRLNRCDAGQYRTKVAAQFTQEISETYRAMEKYQVRDFLNLAGLCQTKPAHELLFVDDVHYTAEFSREVAEAISKPLVRALAPSPKG